MLQEECTRRKGPLLPMGESSGPHGELLLAPAHVVPRSQSSNRRRTPDTALHISWSPRDANFPIKMEDCRGAMHGTVNAGR